MVTNFFWMFVEGCYLHTAIVMTYSTDKLRKWVFLFIGWCELISLVAARPKRRNQLPFLLATDLNVPMRWKCFAKCLRFWFIETDSFLVSLCASECNEISGEHVIFCLYFDLKHQGKKYSAYRKWSMARGPFLAPGPLSRIPPLPLWTVLFWKKL